MKKIILAILAITLCLCGTLHATSTVTQSYTNIVADSSAQQMGQPVGNGKRVISVAVTADSGGAVTPFTVPGMVGWFLYHVEVQNGTSASTQTYNIDMTSAMGLNILGTLLHTLSYTATSDQYITTGLTNKGFYVPVADPTVAITSLSAGAQVNIIFTLLAQ